MTSPLYTAQFSLKPDDSLRLASLCGHYDKNLRMLEKRIGVSIKNRGNFFEVIGKTAEVEQAAILLKQLYEETAAGNLITEESIHLNTQESHLEHIVAAQHSEFAEAKVANGESFSTETNVIEGIKTPKKFVRPRGGNQISYVQAIRNNDISFGVGPAGTGKTWLAVACAVEALEQERVDRILLVRPAVEAGEKLGFLPGDLTQKIDPYLRPLYDALYEMLGVDAVTKKMERNIIEVAPLAFMRGRTLNNSFIILDESQNTTREQMKMFLTRIGFGSTAVITGDDSQIDLPRRSDSGLLHVKQVLHNVSGITFTEFESRDVVRHPLVQRIVEAYAANQDNNER